MKTDGIEAVFPTTHNWGKAAKFFKALGFTLEFKTGHNSGQLRNGDGSYLFIAEVPESERPEAQIVLRGRNEEAFQPASIVEVVTPFEDTHWGTREMTVRDPDGRILIELGFGVPAWLSFVPVDFEAGVSWQDRIVSAGFDESKPSVVASTGVSMYLTKECECRHAGPGRRACSGIDARHDLHGAVGACGPRDTSRRGGGRQRRARKRRAFHQLLCAAGDHRAGPGSWLQRGATRFLGRSCSAILRG
jgi:hypothetical protein